MGEDFPVHWFKKKFNCDDDDNDGDDDDEEGDNDDSDDDEDNGDDLIGRRESLSNFPQFNFPHSLTLVQENLLHLMTHLYLYLDVFVFLKR